MTSDPGDLGCRNLPVGVADRAFQGVRFVHSGGDFVLPSLSSMSGSWRLLDAQGQVARTGVMPSGGGKVELGSLGAGRWILSVGEHQVVFTATPGTGR